MRYMWIPSTETVVVVQCDPFDGTVPLTGDIPKSEPEGYRLAPLRSLAHATTQVNSHQLQSMNFAQLRDCLLAENPLDAQHVARVNQAEVWSLLVMNFFGD